MPMMTVAEAAHLLNANLLGAGDSSFFRVTTDSRDIREGDIFVAIKGDHFDGHDFVEKALAQGAVAAIVTAGKRWPDSLTLIECKDTLATLGVLAATWRQRFDIPVIAVTGSNGKTSVKEMIAAILRNKFGAEAVLATIGNLNNHIGVPLMLLRLNEQHRVAVLEMGMNHFGEIRYLTEMSKPDVALVNNAGAAHLEFLGSVEGVARAKGEIYEGLEAEGIAIFNADDAFADYWRNLNAGRKCLAFGLNTGDAYATDIELGTMSSAFNLHLFGDHTKVTLAIPGDHMVRNALAAAAACAGIGMKIEDIAAGLQSFTGVKGRLQQKSGRNDSLVIDDSYNANPMSMCAAIDVLAKFSGKRILVLGDMGEVGAHSAVCHQEVCRYAAQNGIDVLLTTGQAMREATPAFGVGGRWFESRDALALALNELLAPQTTVLVKGSRFMAMEKVVETLTRPVDAPGKEK